MIITKECKRCGKQFNTDRNAQQFCSANCRRQYREFGVKQTEFICLNCGKTFQSERKKKYCSKNCGNIYNGRTNYTKPKSERNAEKPKNSLAEINAKAKAEGLSYGQYFAKYGY